MTNELNIESSRIRRAAECVIPPIIIGADAFCESSMIYGSLSTIGRLLSIPYLTSNIAAGTAGSFVFLAEIFSGHPNVKNALRSSIEEIKNRNIDPKALFAFFVGICATTPEAFFSNRAFKEISQEHKIKISPYHYLSIAGMIMSHGVIYQIPIKELLSKSLSQTASDAVKFFTNKGIRNNIISTALLALAGYRTYQFAAHEHEEAIELCGKESNLPYISTTLSFIGTIPLNIFATKEFIKLMHRDPNPHEILQEDSISHHHTHHHHENILGKFGHMLIFALGAMASTLPIISQDLVEFFDHKDQTHNKNEKQDLFAMIASFAALSLAAFIVFKYIHDKGHADQQPSTVVRNPILPVQNNRINEIQ